MPAPRIVTATAKFRRAKDKVRIVDTQLQLARLEASRAALECQEAGVTRTELASIWGTNVNQIDRMLTRARAERR